MTLTEGAIMIRCKGYATQNPKDKLNLFNFERRELNENDVLIDIKFCGVCHSDIHQARNEWGNSIYPMVPGHEIVGIISQLGSKVKKFQIGDRVGVGCMVDSCKACTSCKENLEQYCEKGAVSTYNSKEYETGAITFGGYSTCIVVKEDFVLKVPDNLDLAKAAPLLCAGITTYSPLKHWGVKKNDKVGVVGLGGLGHMALKIANAMGANVYVFTTSESKIEDAKKMGAKGVILSKDAKAVQKENSTFDFIINTVAAPHDLALYMNCLKRDKTMVMVGVPDKPHASFAVDNLIFKRRSIGGSLIGGIQETQEMLNFCSEHDIVCDIELIKIDQINEAYERTIKSDVKYRFVIDIASLK